MPASRRIRIAVNRRREKIAALYLQGFTQCEIAEQIGVRQPTVSTDLKKIQEQWRASAVRDFDLMREEQLQKIDAVERAAWLAWERSQKPKQRAQTSDQPNARNTKRTIENRAGDPRYLDIVHKCIAARREMLGLDAPERVEIETNETSDTERRDRVLTIAATLCERAGIEDAREGSGVDEPRRLCDGSERGEMAAGETPDVSE